MPAPVPSPASIAAPHSVKGAGAGLAGARVFIAVVAATAVLATLLLGQWQLRRAAQKLGMAQQIVRQESQETLANKALTATKNIANTAAVTALFNRRVALQGQWLHQHTVYLQNRQMHRQQGFYVVTPLRLEPQGQDPVNAESQAVVLVQRGWVPRDFQDMTRLPPVADPQGHVQVGGRVIAQLSSVFALGTDSPLTSAALPQASASAPRIRHNLDIATFAAQTGLPLLPVVVLQTDANSDGVQRQWLAVESGVEKHYGYAFQWFALCGLVVVLYVWFQIISPRRRRAAIEQNL